MDPILPLTVHTENHLLFSVSPSLPQGLTLDPKTGRISGKPVLPAERTEFTVTGRNIRGEVTAVIVLAVAGFWQNFHPRDWSRAMVQIWLKDELLMSEDDRTHFAKVDGTELITLQSMADVAAKFPSLSPLVQNMLAQKVGSAVVAWARDPEEEAVIAQIKAAAAAAGLDVKDQFDIDKFDADKLIMGLPPDAGLGVANFLNHPQGQEGLFSEMGKGLPALLEEMEKNGLAEEQNCADYVLNKEAGSDPPNITFQNGWRRDCDPFTGKVLESRQVDDPSAPGGKRGMRFADFMLHAIVIMCQLTEAEVFALRFYTTAGFKGINWQEFLKILWSEFTYQIY
jgi:hypothetical protein